MADMTQAGGGGDDETAVQELKKRPMEAPQGTQKADTAHLGAGAASAPSSHTLRRKTRPLSSPAAAGSRTARMAGGGGGGEADKKTRSEKDETRREKDETMTGGLAVVGWTHRLQAGCS